jgi:3-isopropylmalate dehydratase small subunit
MLLIQLSMIEPSKTKEHEGYCVIAGDNFAQGSSREHAALAPKYLGQKFAIANLTLASVGKT